MQGWASPEEHSSALESASPYSPEAGIWFEGSLSVPIFSFSVMVEPCTLSPPDIGGPAALCCGSCPVHWM